MTHTPMKDTSSAGTPEWMAPELMQNEPFTEKCDIFSLGVIMWELSTLSRPWDGVPPERVYAGISSFPFFQFIIYLCKLRSHICSSSFVFSHFHVTVISVKFRLFMLLQMRDRGWRYLKDHWAS
ncbi:serine/threonine-protein kinase edr1 [Phtheirospermum japonicum]|uniref:Serine/threonine-protein kinase edr1 n=1 Tax=Phtheirospermum japonicum TaxID=374723 RepID=A0A830B0M5_9LAMI|nr:serine/threonine-protein kinase edr1 [Phtheirospermum japonicum]